MMDYQFYNAW